MNDDIKENIFSYLSYFHLYNTMRQEEKTFSTDDINNTLIKIGNFINHTVNPCRRDYIKLFTYTLYLNL